MEEIEDIPVPVPVSSFLQDVFGRPDNTFQMASRMPKSIPYKKSVPIPPSKKSLGTGSFLRVRVRPTVILPDDPWSPMPCFTEGSVEFQFGNTFRFGANYKTKQVQSDSGNSAGFCCNSSLFNLMIGESTPWCWAEFDHTHNQGISRAALVKISIPSVKLITYSFVLEIPDLTEPLFGRFMTTDALTIVHQGYLASAAKLPLQNGILSENKNVGLSPVQEGYQSVTIPPDFATIRKKLIESTIGKNLHKAMTDEYKIGAEAKKGGELDNALFHFQRVSVYGFFVFSDKDLANAYQALAATLRDTKNVDLAIVWARRSQELDNKDSIKTLITKLESMKM